MIHFAHPPGSIPGRTAESARLAVTPLSDLGYLPTRATDAIREVMPARRLQVTQHDLPAEDVRTGNARFGLLDAEDFYDFDPSGALTPAQDIEAVAAVGSRLAHVIARTGVSMAFSVRTRISRGRLRYGPARAARAGAAGGVTLHHCIPELNQGGTERFGKSNNSFIKPRFRRPRASPRGTRPATTGGSRAMHRAAPSASVPAGLC